MSTNISKTSQYRYRFHEHSCTLLQLLHADGRTDMALLILAFLQLSIANGKLSNSSHLVRIPFL